MAVIAHLIGKPREGMAEKKPRKKLPPRPSHSDLSGRKIRVVFDDPDATESSEDEGISHKRKRGICESRVVAPPESDGSKRKKPAATTLPKAKVKSAGSESSGRFKGVRQRPWGRWAAEIRNPGGSRIWLGTFDTAEAAAAAYKDAALRFKAEKENQSFTGSSSTATTVSCRVKKENQSVSSSSSSSSTVSTIPFRVKKKKNHSVGVFSSTATTLPLQSKKENLSVTTSSEMTAASSSSSSASVDSPIKQPTSPTSVLDVSSSSSGSPTNSCSEPEEEEEEESSFADLFEALPLEVEADLGFHSDDFFFSNRLQSEEAIAGWLDLEL